MTSMVIFWTTDWIVTATIVARRKWCIFVMGIVPVGMIWRVNKSTVISNNTGG